MTFKNEGKFILFEATFEVKTSSFSRLIEASVNTLSAALMSGLLLERLTFKKCGCSTAEFDGTDWVWEIGSLTFNVSDWSIAEFDDRDWISELESFNFNGNSN